MEAILCLEGIEYPSKCTNDVLSKLISEFLENVEKKFVVDTFLLDEYGIYVLRLPPYHCDLNPIEKIWSVRKQHVAKHKSTNNITDVEILWRDSRDKVELDVFANLFRRIREVEDQFAKIDGLDCAETDADEQEDMDDVSAFAEILDDEEL